MRMISVLFLLAFSLPGALLTGSLAGGGATVIAPQVGPSPIGFLGNPIGSTSLADGDFALLAAGNLSISSLLAFTGDLLQFTWTGGLVFDAPMSVVAETVPGAFVLTMVGFYSAAGFDTTPGMLSFTFQAPPVGNLYSNSFSGMATAAPEGATGAMVGGAILALGLFRRLDGRR